jgi:pimeloyl-ACP methyl ester carboxylesterase
VVLLHGLWLNRYALVGWRRQFERSGVCALAFGYPSRDPVAGNALRLADFLEHLDASGVYLLGHSLGGLLILDLLRQRVEDCGGTLRIRRAVLAGTPVAGSQAGRRFAKSALGHWLIGKGGDSFELPSQQCLAHSGVDIGVIAGTRGPGLGRLFGALPLPNDGTVSLAETRLAGAADAIALPVNHTEMLLSRTVVCEALRFFVSGHFDHGHHAPG